MQPGDLVRFMGDNGRLDIRVGSTGLVLSVRKNPFGCLYEDAEFEFDALVDGNVVREILLYDFVEVISEAG